jgi:hypothetical protein
VPPPEPAIVINPKIELLLTVGENVTLLVILNTNSLKLGFIKFDKVQNISKKFLVLF